MYIYIYICVCVYMYRCMSVDTCTSLSIFCSETLAHFTSSAQCGSAR